MDVSIWYGPYLPLHWSSMKGMPTDKADSFIKAEMFITSVARKPYSGLPYDQWIEKQDGSRMD